MDKQLLRSLIHEKLNKLDPYFISQQSQSIQEPNYPIDNNQTGIAEYIVENGITDVLIPQIREAAIRAIVHCAFIQLLMESTLQRDLVSIFNNIILSAPEEMYKSLPADAIYPHGINKLVRTVNGVDKYLPVLKEVNNFNLVNRDLIQRITEYLFYQYGFNPQIDTEINTALNSLSIKQRNTDVINTAAMILMIAKMTDLYYYTLAYINKADPNKCYKEPNAIGKYYYISGISNELSNVLQNKIELREIDIDKLKSDELSAKIGTIVSFYQMVSIVSSELPDSVNTLEVDQMNYGDLSVLTLYIVLDKRTKYHRIFYELFS